MIPIILPPNVIEHFYRGGSRLAQLRGFEPYSAYLPEEWLVEADIPPGEVTKPHYRHALVPQVARACALARGYEASARVGAGRLAFRQRWAVLSAANIYGGIAREVERLGAHAWDHRVVVGKARKLSLVARALAQASAAPAPAAKPAVSRRELAALARSDPPKL